MSTETSGLAIETAGLVKTFGTTRAVDGVDLRVPAGTVYGVLGPNGAGKTTAVRMLATLLRPDAGEARVFGHDVVREADEVRARVSLTGQYASVDEDLTGAENLTLLARLLGHGRPAARRRSEQLLAAFGLTEAASRQIKHYSGGMRRRIDIAASILNTPDLLFLDEPTTGLDPRSRNQVWNIVRAVVAQGTTVLLTTQYLDEADQLASRIAVIDRGKVIAEGTKGELKASVGAGSVHLRLREAGRRADAERVLRGLPAAEVQLDGDPVALTARLTATAGDSAAEQAARALAALTRAGITVDHFSLGQPSLDEVFLALTGHGTGQEGLPSPDDDPKDGVAA
ncbi:ATP-binding cassette domain-containing protein [Streptomyces griseoviridis]|jgi:ABC-2 type transport system ATP-binding protein|uniref:ABC-2 type transport system ATP-binding protein n=2 Tax=Streptomyces griseoviridis TaxID=45398 RepID=A0ABT9LGZ7_STRGD|nr:MULTISPECIES: ATP-binding cassette domain-containing protein [Streptomyces]MDP9682995.1 ABC-2 type transport system ATP-binding protein [Streptomyces griseoviridis]GGS37181.1 daunorubicin resistance protein DrrA family ABC transporter ATP-binding protein [Streptomyces niveoruber]GGS90116.1 daunorubicin resistance protein DrrA family ABC transporter ATP-binding protein [Streptomyces griseoviridis]